MTIKIKHLNTHRGSNIIGLPFISRAVFEELISREPLLPFISFCGDMLLGIFSATVWFLTEAMLWFAVCAFPATFAEASLVNKLPQFCIDFDCCCCDEFDRCIEFTILDDVVNEDGDDVVASSCKWPRVDDEWGFI